VVNHGSSSEIKAGINEFIMPSMFDDDVKLISKKEFEDEFICALSVLRSGPFSDLSGNIII
jgi:hypothetical protein